MEYNIRPLTIKDKSDVEEISKVTWEGHDYLQHYFEKMISDPNSHPLGMEIGGRIKALANLKIIENGKTGWMEILRVHPDERGKKFASIMTDRILELGVSLGVERFRYTTANENDESLHLAKKIGMKRITEMSIDWLEFEQIKHLSKEEKEIKKIEKNRVPQFINEHNLIPANVIIHDWKAVNINLESLEYLEPEIIYWISNTNEAAISLSNIQKWNDIIQYMLTIYPSDQEAFMKHIGFHLFKAKKAGSTNIVWSFPPEYRTTIEDRIKRKEEVFDIRTVLFEKKVS